MTSVMFSRFSLMIFLSLGNSNSPIWGAAVILDGSDQSRTTEKPASEHTFEAVDGFARPTTTKTIWNYHTHPPLYANANFAPAPTSNESDDEQLYRALEEAESSFETGTNTMVTRDQSALPTTTRAFWNSKQRKETQLKTANLERDLLSQYDQALLNTDLTKLDADTLRKVCTISSPSQTYYNARSPKFIKKRIRFFTSKRRKMTANLLFCPNMHAYVRESATNPNQCVYIFKRPLFRTKLWLRDQKCVNLNTEVTAPKPEE